MIPVDLLGEAIEVMQAHRDKVVAERKLINELQSEVLDRMCAAQDQLQLDKAKALFALLQWKFQTFPTNVM